MLDQLNRVHVPQDNLTPIIYDMIFVLFGAKQMKMVIFLFCLFCCYIAFYFVPQWRTTERPNNGGHLCSKCRRTTERPNKVQGDSEAV
jgi:hypothetical protein